MLNAYHIQSYYTHEGHNITHIRVNIIPAGYDPMIRIKYFYFHHFLNDEHTYLIYII